MVLFHYWSGVINGQLSADVTELRYSWAFFAQLKFKGIISGLPYLDTFYSSYGNE
jgi:hypothetical protein